jgi:hypothetical protein
MKSVCKIDELKSENVHVTVTHPDISMDKNELMGIIFDGSRGINDNLTAFRIYCDKYKNNSIELLQSIMSMYCFSSSCLLENMIIEICERDDIDIPLYKKFDCFKTVYSTCYKPEKLIKFGRVIASHQSKNDMSCVTMHVDNLRYLHSIYTLMGIENNELFSCFFNNQDIDCEYRYKELISLFTRFIYQNDNARSGGGGSSYTVDYNISQDLKKELTTPKKVDYIFYSNFIVDSCAREFIENTNNNNTFRILTLQYIIGVTRLREWSQKKLLEMSTDEGLGYNKKADCIDVILSLGDDKYKETAKHNLLNLGVGERQDKSIYGFRQNVHMVDECVEKEFLKLVKFHNSLKSTQSFTEIYKKFFKDESHSDEIKVSILRIINDNYRYKSYSMTDIFSMVWNVANSGDPDQSVEVLQRFMEELTEMSDTCTSGHITRLVNVLSGFNFTNPQGDLVEFLVGIKWEDQIYNYLQSQFMKKIYRLDNDEYIGDILIEMDCDIPLSSKQNLYKFYIENISDIVILIRKEFVDKCLLESRVFDDYMSMAIIKLFT